MRKLRCGTTENRFYMEVQTALPSNLQLRFICTLSVSTRQRGNINIKQKGGEGGFNFSYGNPLLVNKQSFSEIHVVSLCTKGMKI